MKITNIQIDAFGAWRKLDLGGLKDHVSVFYGPNEAGKTTLMHFVRAMLYGFDSARRRRYVPPVDGGPAGGSLDIATPSGRFQLCRQTGEGRREDDVSLVATDGTVQGGHLLGIVLSGIDEAIYNNVFAIGLGEIQELGSLEDTDAAQLLHGLSAGLDRVSLLEVMRELGTSRDALWSPGRTSRIGSLLAERDRIAAEIDQKSTDTHRYLRLSAERDRIDRDVVAFEEAAGEIERELRLIDLAVGLGDRWRRRAAIDAEIGPPSDARPAVVDALAQLEKLREGLSVWRKRRAKLQAEHQRFVARCKEIHIPADLERLAARVDAMVDQSAWITSLADEVSHLGDQLQKLTGEESAERKKAGASDATSRRIGDAKALRPIWRAVHQAKDRMEDARKVANERRSALDATANELGKSLGNRGATELATLVERAGENVSRLRRHIQLDERLEQLEREKNELAGTNDRPTQKFPVPPWAFPALGGGFFLGVMLIGTGLFIPKSFVYPLGWTVAVVSMCLTGGLAAMKVFWERSASGAAATARNQLQTVNGQLNELTAERASLATNLARSGEPLPVRLQAAERELAELQALTPLDQRRQAVHREAAAAAAECQRLEKEHAEFRRRWRDALAARGLPSDWSPTEIRRSLVHAKRMATLAKQIARCRRRLEHRQQELAGVVTRMAQLGAELGLSPDSDAPAEFLARMTAAIKMHRGQVDERRKLVKLVRGVRRRAERCDERYRRDLGRRKSLLAELGAADEADVRHMYEQQMRIERLRVEREQLGGEIAAALAGQVSEDALAKLLAAHDSAQLDARWDALGAKLEQSRAHLKHLYQEQGQVVEQLKVLAGDRQLGQLELRRAVIEQQLEEAVARWQVLAVAGRVLDQVRHEYETTRQPQTLRDASEYLRELTAGRYRRVWTPLAEDALRVDDADGRSLGVDVLSRGTREQLFLALRLALVKSYARRGAALPMILDDVLVNLDGERASGAARVLRDFAAAGHQILVFTCHEHIAQTFHALKVDVRELPGHRAPLLREIASERPVVAEAPPVEKRPRPRRPKPVVAMERPPVAASAPTPATRLEGWRQQAWDPAIEVPIEQFAVTEDTVLSVDGYLERANDELRAAGVHDEAEAA